MAPRAAITHEVNGATCGESDRGSRFMDYMDYMDDMDYGLETESGRRLPVFLEGRGEGRSGALLVRHISRTPLTAHLSRADHRSEHRRHQSLVAIADAITVRFSDGQVSARALHGGTRDEMISRRRTQEIDLELHAEDVRSMRHQRERGIPARGVEQGGDDRGMQETVLLREVSPRLDRHVDLSGLHAVE